MTTIDNGIVSLTFSSDYVVEENITAESINLIDGIATGNNTNNLFTKTQQNHNDIMKRMVDDDNVNHPEPYSEMYMRSYIKYADHFKNSKIVPEDILSVRSKKYTVLPINYRNVWNNYKEQLAIHWVVEEVDLSKDVYDWIHKLSADDRFFLMHVLAFFSAADGLVNANIKTNCIDVVTIKEAECAYGCQFNMENIHGEMYSLMIETFVKDEDVKRGLIDSIRRMPAIKRKADWCKKWIDSDTTYAHKLVAFAFVEGVFFSGSFCSIFWLKTRSGGIMPGLRKSNKFIARDENKHFELACILNGLLKNRLREEIVHEMLEEAIAIEIDFIIESLPCKLLGMNSDSMIEYIKYVADRSLVQLGYTKKYNAENPFEFMKKIDTYVKGNFFEDREDSYSNSKIGNVREFEILTEF